MELLRYECDNRDKVIYYMGTFICFFYGAIIDGFTLLHGT